MLKENIKIEEDGITHINCYSKGRTDLGRMLSNFSLSHFKISDGEFYSMEGYWYWLLAYDHPDRDELKDLYGWRAKQFGKTIIDKDYPTEEEFYRIFKSKIRVALEAKLNQNAVLKTAFINSNLPLAHYYTYSTKIVCDGKSDWVWEHYETLREKYK